MKLSQLKRDSRIQRRFLLSSIAIAIIIVALAVVALILLAVFSYKSNADRLAAAGAIFGGAAVLLAVIAALVALLAYAVSTGSPNMLLRVQFEYSHFNKPSFKAEVQENGWLKADVFKQTTGRISLHNISRYSAVNPTVIIRLQGMAFRDAPLVSLGRKKEWAQMDFANTVGITAIQWDGGPQYSIHGESTRVLPTLSLDLLWQIPDWGTPALVFEILANGYRREVTVPVSFVLKRQSEPEQDIANLPPEWI